jgi:hypothetical protein
MEAAAPPEGVHVSSASRPTGVTILAILALIGGVFGIIGGLLAIAGGALFGAVAVTTPEANGAGAFGGMLFIIGILTLGVAIVDLAFAFGAWTLKPWGWSLGIISQLASLVLVVISAVLSGNFVGSLMGSVISIAISVAILWYLNQPAIKSAFGRA